MTVQELIDRLSLFDLGMEVAVGAEQESPALHIARSASDGTELLVINGFRTASSR